MHPHRAVFAPTDTFFSLKSRHRGMWDQGYPSLCTVPFWVTTCKNTNIWKWPHVVLPLKSYMITWKNEHLQVSQVFNFKWFEPSFSKLSLHFQLIWISYFKLFKFSISSDLSLHLQVSRIFIFKGSWAVTILVVTISPRIEWVLAGVKTVQWTHLCWFHSSITLLWM